MSQPVVMIGASGFGRESLEVLDALGVPVGGVVDDAPSEANVERLAALGVAHLGGLADWLAGAPDQAFVVGIGSPSVRRRIAQRLLTAGLSPFTAVHPSALVGRRTVVGAGAVICMGAIVSTNVRLGAQVHLNPGVIIGHDARLADFVSVNPGAVISGEVLIEQDVLVGASATILQNLTVGAGAVIGAGAVVTRDVPAGAVVKGVPGRWK